MKSDLNINRAEVDFLLSTRAIREKAGQIFDLTTKEQSLFRFHPDKMKPTVEFVLQVIRKNYPDMQVPFHSRWRHFTAGGVNRLQKLDAVIAAFDPLERARIKLDLVITSVLLDAGAGPTWRYLEADSKQSFSRSEGLGVASFHMFLCGAMSSDRHSPRADAMALRSLAVSELRDHFQVREENPLIGIEGRLQLLNNLAAAVSNPEIFSGKRPGHILDYLLTRYGRSIPATGILRAVLDGFGSIWPGRLSAGGVNLGDVWQHPKVGLVPLHKLSQWMTYSLIEPIVEAGITVTGVEELTGLAEYRNGGLMLDSGLLSVRDRGDLEKSWRPESEMVIEWRALTVCLLDQLGSELQKALGLGPKEFPLAKILEGGTWWAGRALAQEKRGGDPPLKVVSDGTVF